MSGYRKPTFDPNFTAPVGPPLRPFDKWQWLGVTVGSAGLLLFFAELSGQFGLLPQTVKAPTGAILFLAVGGSLLINYRRETLPADRLPNSSPARRRLIAIAVAIVGVALATFAILSSPGA